VINPSIKKYLFFCFSFLSIHSFSQSISVNNDAFNDYLKREQLNGSINPDHSFCVRPVQSNNFDSSNWLNGNTKTKLFDKHSKFLNGIELLPFIVTQQANSHHPYGWNDGPMIPAKGYQLYMSAGIFAKWGHFSIQLAPEIVYAQNDSFQTFLTEYSDYHWNNYYQWLNRIDMPERFGNKSYKKILPGQSSIRYNTKDISIGLSTENLWWGPGKRNALVMSNNAPGFLHATINSVKPIQTAIGSFEGQIIAGKLENSGILPPDTFRVYNGSPMYQPKNNESRFISGMVLSWQPKWVKGLFLGFAKTSYLYQSDISGIADILPLEGIITSNSEKQNKKASLGSIFFRYVLLEEQAEIYAEYGRSDRSASIINLITDNGYPRGYVVGMRKLTDKRANGSQFEFAAEITQLELPTATLINQAKSWYTNDYVRQGYTNQGQVMGAAVGPGGSSQMIDISWVKGMTKIGVQFERVVHNNDFYYYSFANPPDVTRHWIDLSSTFHADWRYKRFLFSTEMGVIRSLNYEWWVIPYSGYFENGYDFLNFHGKISFSYRL